MLPVAYDFDFAGAVNASYAVPPTGLRRPERARRASSSRILRAARRVPRRARACFQEKKDAIYALYHDEIGKLMKPDVVRETLEYFDDFYNDVSTPNDAKRHVRSLHRAGLSDSARGASDDGRAVRAPLRRGARCARTRAAAARAFAAASRGARRIATSTSTRPTTRSARARRRLSPARRRARCRTGSSLRIAGRRRHPSAIDARVRSADPAEAVRAGHRRATAPARAGRSGGARRAHRARGRTAHARRATPISAASVRRAALRPRHRAPRRRRAHALPALRASSPWRRSELSSGWCTRWSASTTSPAQAGDPREQAELLLRWMRPAPAQQRFASSDESSPIGDDARTAGDAHPRAEPPRLPAPRARDRRGSARRRSASGCASSGS